MKKHLLIFICIHSFYAAQQSSPSLSTNNMPEKGMLDLLNSFCVAFPEPEDDQLLPSLETSITDIYQNALALPQTIIDPLKRVYNYLQQGVFDTQLASLAEQIRTAKATQATLKAGDPLYKKTEDKITALQTQYTQAQKNLDKTIVSLLATTDSWQHHLKIFITKTIDYEAQLLKSVYQQERALFPYIPTLETAYYSQEYTTISISNQLVRIFIALNERLIQRAQALCSDWKTYTSPEQLYAAVTIYKQSEFYTLSQTLQTVTHDTTTYPFDSSIELVKNNTIIIPALIPYFSLDENQTLTVTPLGKLAFGVDKQGKPYMTALGNLLFILIPATQKSPVKLSYTKTFYQLFTETAHGFLPKPLYTQIIGLQALALLNGSISYLFNSANLDQTMQNMQKNIQIIEKTPVFFHYRPSDYLYLQEINTLSAKLSDTDQSPDVQSFFHHLFHSISHAFHSFAHDVVHFTKTVADDSLHLVEHIGETVADTGLGLYYASGLACITGMSYSKAQQKAGKEFNAAALNIEKAGKDLEAIANASAALATQAANTFGSLTGKLLGTILQDPHLATDFSGLFDTIADTAIALNKDMMNIAIQDATSVVKLSYEGVTIVADAVLGAQAEQSLTSSFAKSIITALLQQVTMVTSMLGTALKAVMQTTAYLANTITDVIADVAGMTGALDALITGGNLEDSYKDFQQKIQDHRRLISGIITTVATIAMTGISFPAGGGALAVSMFALGVAMNGMMIPGLIGDAQQDQEHAQSLQQQTNALASYKKYIQDNETAAPLLNKLSVQAAQISLKNKMQTAHYNALYYNNHLNDIINSKSKQVALQLGSFYAQGFTPDQTGVPLLDTGYYYHIKTNRYALNPSQGMTIYNYARNSFAQEIACVPTQSANSSTSNTQSLAQQVTPTINQTPPQFWLHQKDIAPLSNNDTLTVEIRLRSIYQTGGAFYIGLFMTEKYLDTQKISALYNNFTAGQKLGPEHVMLKKQTYENFQKVSNDLLNFDDLSRAFVFFRTSSTQTPTLGLYQHQGAAWINNKIPGPTYQRGVWYRMRMSITQNQTKVTCWQEGQQPSTEQTFTLSPAQPIMYPEVINLPTNNGSFTQSTTQTVQKPSSISSNKELTVHAAQGMLVPSTPQREVIQNNSGITNNVAQWTLQKPEQLSDNVATLETNNTSQTIGSFGIISAGAAVEYQIISPAQTVTLSPLRIQENQTLTQELTQQSQPATEKDRELQWQKNLIQETSPQFGSFTLTPVSNSLISQGVFLYTTKDTHLADNLTDYVAFAAEVSSTSATVQNLGMNPIHNPQVLVSLVTGKAYTLQNNTPVVCSGVLQAFISQFALTQTVQKKITAASGRYFKDLVEPFKFKNITLTADLSCLQNGLGLYSASPIDPLIKSKDYFVCAQLDTQNNVQNSGMLLTSSNQINGFISFVSGNIYRIYTGTQQVDSLATVKQLSQVSLKQITTTSPQLNLYTIYQSQISSNLYTTIAQANSTYQTQTTTNQTTTQSQQNSNQIAASTPAIPTLPTYQPCNSTTYNDYSSYSGGYSMFGPP